MPFGTSYESGLQDHEPRIVTGVKGLRSQRFKKRFRNQAAQDKWMDSDDFDHEVHFVTRDEDRIERNAKVNESATKVLDSLIKNDQVGAVDEMQSLIKSRAREIIGSAYAQRNEETVEEEVVADEE